MQRLIIYQIFLTIAYVQNTLANHSTRHSPPPPQKKKFGFLTFLTCNVYFLYYPCKYIVPGSTYCYPVNLILTCRLQLIKNVSSCSKVCLSQRYRDSLNEWENVSGKYYEIVIPDLVLSDEAENMRRYARDWAMPESSWINTDIICILCILRGLNLFIITILIT
jgi:hypothetical protein